MFDSEKCDFCGECLAQCQYVNYDLDRAQREIKELVDGGCPPIVADCVTCVACNQTCPNGANPFDLINMRQEETGALGIPEDSFDKFSQLHGLPNRIISGDPRKPAVNLCIVGAMVKEQIEGSLFSGLTKVEGADYFCTLGYVHLGRPSIVKENIPRFINKLADLRKDRIICFHDDCYSLLAIEAKESGLKLPFIPVHLFEYLLEQLEGRQKEIEPLNIKVAYQAPCASRYTPEKDHYLDEIFDLVGVERITRTFERETGLCCGAPLMAKDRDRALHIKNLNVRDASDNGAQAMVFLCPMCFLNLRKICKENNVKPVFLTDLCYYALGEKSFEG